MKLTYLFVMTIITMGVLLGCSKKKEPAPPAQSDTTKSDSTIDSATDPKTSTETEAEPKVASSDSATDSTTPPQTSAEAIAKPKVAPLDGLTYVKGNAVTIEVGKVYVIEFWATWCPPCRDSIPHLTEIQKKYKDKGVTVIGISQEPINTVKPFVEKMGDKMDYTVAVDPDSKVADGYMGEYNQRMIPTAFVVNSKGNIAWIGHPMDGLDEVLEKIISEQMPAK